MKRSPLARKTPLKRTGIRSKKAGAPRRKVPGGCSSRGCATGHVPIRVAEGERYCLKHGKAKADDAARAYVRARDPRCVACGRSDEGVQWAHVHTRGMRFIRWDAQNAVGLCARCHYAYTKRPAAWVKFVERNTPGLWVRLLHRELWGDQQGGSVDVGEVIRSYRAGEPWYAEDPPKGWAPGSE